jgi:hypothetical protein
MLQIGIASGGISIHVLLTPEKGLGTVERVYCYERKELGVVVIDIVPRKVTAEE